MRLMSPKRHYESSANYCLTERVSIQKETKLIPIDDLLDFITQFESERELSISLEPLKDIKLIERFYTFSNPIEVKRFLLGHNYLIEHLFEAQKEIKRIFGEHIVEVCLEYDKDSEEDFEGLSAIVKTNLSPDQSLDLLSKFDEEYWLDVDDEIRKALEVMVMPLGFEDLLTQEQKKKKLKAVKKYFGLLSDLTSEQWEQFTEAIKRRPFFEKRGRDGL